jgi:thiol-disulfide isomerase/thioredoxin
MDASAPLRRIRRKGLVLTALAGALAMAGAGLFALAAPETAADAAKKTCKSGELARGCPAPEFPAGLEWLNTAEPITLASLRGKIVLLDFWTYGCINCMHVIPDLKKLEARYANQLVVVGVHSAKFAGEKSTASIRQAILRYDLEHPVLNDGDFEAWQSYGVRGWPTAALIDPDGNLARVRVGEGVFAAFDPVIGAMVSQFRALKRLDEKPVKFALEKDAIPKSLLSFPGKILADEAGDRLFISDTNHHRILVASLDGTVREVIGSGAIGARDGAFADAQFKSPQGLAVDGKILYVCDTGNHTIRRLDLEKRSVETFAGTGRQAQDLNVPGIGTKVDLSSPWDALVQDGKLYVAMAGTHQLWSIDLATRAAAPFAGSGAEGRRDGVLLQSELAQPSGLATDGRSLFFADSEASAIRAAALDGSGDAGVTTAGVTTLLGLGKGLFDFGDIDGVGETVRLQHPLGVAYRDGLLYVADTYNHKIKRVDLKNPIQGSSALPDEVRKKFPPRYQSVTFAGTGKDGTTDGKGDQAQFDEPGGISITSKALYVADTNNNAIRTVDLASGEVSTLQLKGLDTIAKHVQKEFKGRAVSVAKQAIAPGPAKLALSFTIPEGYEFNAAAPFYLAYRSEDGKAIKLDESSRNFEPKFPLEIPFEAVQGQGTVTVDAVIYFCDERAKKVCLIDSVRASVPLEVKAGGPTQVPVQIAGQTKAGGR